MNKTVFGCKGEERWAILPEMKAARTKTAKAKAKNLEPKTLSPAEQLIRLLKAA